MSVYQLSVAVEAFGRRGQPVALSIAEVVFGVVGIIAAVGIFVYRKRRGLPVGRQEQVNPKTEMEELSTPTQS